MTNHGMVHLPTNHSVEDILGKLQTILKTKGVPVFALVDHSGEAAKVGMEMRPTKLLIFGNPKAGTPVMLSAPSAALDLPLKILLAQEPDGTTQVSWNDATWLQQRHDFSPELIANLAAVEALARKAAE